MKPGKVETDISETHGLEEWTHTRFMVIYSHTIERRNYFLLIHLGTNEIEKENKKRELVKRELGSGRQLKVLSRRGRGTYQ